MEQVGAGQIDRSRALYERPSLAFDDETAFYVVKSAVDACFSEKGIRAFLRSLGKTGLRIRDFQGVLNAGKLGPDVPGQYGRLSPRDQGQIREHYLTSLEQVSAPLRDQFFKVYAYY